LLFNDNFTERLVANALNMAMNHPTPQVGKVDLQYRLILFFYQKGILITLGPLTFKPKD